MDADVDEELRFHIEGRVDELERDGWTRQAAREEVMRRFGDVAGVREACRALDRDRARREGRGETMGWIAQDVRYALRTLRRSPVFTAVAVLTLGLGIGATTAVFSVVDAVLFRPLPFPDADRLVAVYERQPERGVERDQPSPPNFTDWRRGATTFEGLAAWTHVSLATSSVEPPEVLLAARASPNLFQVVGVEPLLGRTFVEGEEREPVVLLSRGIWERMYGGDPSVVGRTMVLDETAFQIVGVLPDVSTLEPSGVAVWVPFDFGDPALHRQTRYLTVVGRLRPAVTPEAAEADLDRIQARIAQDFPEANEGWRTRVVPAREVVVGDVDTVLLVVFGAVGFVLLIACANVANLLLGRAAYREREMALRAALGAGRRRLRAQLLTESVVLGALGGAVGTLVAWQLVRLFVALEPGDLPRVAEVSVDLRVLAFALAVSVGTGLLFGLAPAARTPRTDPAGGLGGGAGGGREGTRRALVVAEVAVSLILLVGAGLLLRSVAGLRSVDPGFDAEGVLTARVSLADRDYPDAGARLAYFDEVRRRVGELPGVAAAGWTTTLPMNPTGIDFDLPYRVEGQPALPEEELPEMAYRLASPGYFEAMGIEVVRGRAVEEVDRRGGRRVLVVNETFARQHWPGEDALGKTVTIHYVDDAGLEWEVVGVVADTRHAEVGAPADPQMFVPLHQAEYLFGYMALAVRAAPGTGDVSGAVRAAAAAVDPKYPLYGLAPLSEWLSRATARDRFTATLLGAFAALALVLAAAGIHGVIAYQVARRTREIGLRMALGAERATVLRGVVGEALALAGVGVAVGAVGAVLASRALAGLLFEIGTLDPLTYTGVAAALLAAAALAAWVPARRAASVDPVEALRAE